MDQQTPIDSSQTIEWLNRLIVMAQWNTRLPFYVARLFAEPTIYQEFLSEVRSGVLTTTPSEPPKVDGAVVTARERLLEIVAFAPLLRELFGADHDPFEGATPEHLKLLAYLSDITPDPQSMFYSRNGSFLAVVEALRQSRELETEPLILDWLTRFLTLLETNKTIAEMLFDLAGSDEWYLILASLRDGRDYVRDEDPVVARKLEQWNQALTPDVRGLLFKPGNLSRAPTNLVKLAWEQRQLFDELRAQIPAEIREKDPVEVRKQIAEAALNLFEANNKEVLDDFEAGLSVLAFVAKRYIEVRKFAKLNGLDNGWPELSLMVRANFANFEFVEECLVNRTRPSDADLDTRDARALYNACEKDERLIGFLRLRPYFREIDDDDLRAYRPLPPVVISEQAPKPADTVSGVDIARNQAPAPPQAVSQSTQVSVAISRKDTPAADDVPVYNVSLVAGGQTFLHDAKFSTPNLLNNILAAMGVASEDRLQSTLKEFLASSSGAGEALMARGGSELQKQIFSEQMQTKFSEVIQTKLAEALLTNSAVRVTFSSDEKELHYLPWEWLTPQIAMPGPLLTNMNCSVVRAFPLPPETSPAAIIAPVRLLSIIPSAPSGRRFNSANTVKALEEIGSSEPVVYKPLIGEHATLARIKDDLLSFKPHIVHFEGYVVESSTRLSEGLRVILSKPDEEGIPIEEFGTLLKDNGVQLLVIGRNGVSRIFENIGANGSFQLIKQGLPALISPVRGIDDSSATNFTTEFYRAFLQGNSLEAALHLARRKLVSKGGDWSVFALFADPSRLDQFTVLRPTA